MGATSIITIANKKGGVGKTTTSINLAASYAELGKKILLVDMDPQVNLSEGLGVREQSEESGRHIAAAIGDRLPLKEVVISSDMENIDIVAGSADLENLKAGLLGTSRQHKIVSKLLDPASIKKYDIVLIDTSPSVDIYFQAAMAASHYYLIPLFAESYSATGLMEELQAIEEIRENLNAMLTPIGAVITRFNRRNSTHVKFEKVIRELAKEAKLPVLATVIPLSDAVSGAEAAYLPLNQYSKSLPVTRAYTSLAGEILPQLRGKRMGRRRAPMRLEALEASVEI